MGLTASATPESLGDSGKLMGAAAIAKRSTAGTPKDSLANASSGFSAAFSGVLGSLANAGSASAAALSSIAGSGSTSG